MRFNYFSVAFYMIKARLFKRNVPLAISWSLTNHCNQRCLYCRVWEQQLPELNTKEILGRIDQFSELGTKWISFTGGEPLLRDDIGEIIRHTKEKGIYVTISSNGSLVLEKIEDLNGIDRIKFSLDGPQDIHDYVRGKGSFEKVMQAITLCQSKNIPVRLECVLSKYNLDCIAYLVALAIRKKLIISFQPAIETLLWSNEPNPAAPRSSDEYQQAIKELIRLKKSGAPIYNSLAGLNHLAYWPNKRSIYCSAGQLNLDVESDGTLLSCDRYFCQTYKDSEKEDFADIKKSVARLGRINDCNMCWCSSLVEFNLIMSFNINGIINFFKTY